MNGRIVDGVEVALIMSYVRPLNTVTHLCVPCIKVGDLGHLLSKESCTPSAVEDLCRLVKKCQIRRNNTY